jgi:SAM-dependent methyltransferase
MSDWDNYYKKHTSRKPREQLTRAVALCKEKEFALDLGAGTLIESRFLIEDGFKKVIAVDNSPEVKSFAIGLDKEKFSLVISPFQDFDFQKNKYDLVNAQYSLPFFGPNNFKSFIEKIKDSLKAGGIFVGQFFGTNDGWNSSETSLVFQTKKEAINLLSGLNIIEFNEKEENGQTASGQPKHWHYFDFIAEK